MFVPLGLPSNKLTPFVVTAEGKATDSRDTEGSKIRKTAEFGEAIFTEKHGQSIKGLAHRRNCYAHGYSQMEVARFLRLHYSTISRIFAVNGSANLKTL